MARPMSKRSPAVFGRTANALSARMRRYSSRDRAGARTDHERRVPMILQGKRILVMGLLDTRSFAWAIGERARAEGAEVVYTVQNERFRDTLLRRSFRQEGLNVDDY